MNGQDKGMAELQVGRRILTRGWVGMNDPLPNYGFATLARGKRG